MNCNVHLHTLAIDGLYVPSAGGAGPVFVPVPPPAQDDLWRLVREIHGEVKTLLIRREIIGDEELVDEDPDPAEEPAVFDRIQSASIQGLLAFATPASHVGRLGRDPRAPSVPFERPEAAVYEGYSLHAGVRIGADDREGLEKLCRYVLRPPFAQDRFEMLEDGRIAYRMKRRWSDGTTHIVLTPEELLEKLVALPPSRCALRRTGVPTPREHLVIYHGILAPNATWRAQVVAGSEKGGTCRKTGRGRCSYSWAEMMKRTLKVDVLACPKCGGRMRFIALIGQEQPEVIEKILLSMGYETEMPARAPARDPPECAPDAWDVSGERQNPGNEIEW